MTTKYPPNALAAKLHLPAFDVRDENYVTAYEGWVFTLEPWIGNEWILSMRPISGDVSLTDQKKYPAPQPVAVPSPPKNTGNGQASKKANAGSSPAPVASRPSADPAPAAPARGIPDAPAAVPRASAPSQPEPANSLLLCTVIVDVRGLDKNFQRAQSSFVFDDHGKQLWPDAALIRGVSSQLVNEGDLQDYLTSESQIARFKNITRVKAFKVQATKFAPDSSYIVDAVLGPNATKEFKAAGQSCRVAFLKD